MSRLRGRSQNCESQESCPGVPGATFTRERFGAAKARPRLMGLLLALITLLVYLPVAHDDFLVYDDDVYVTQNPVVQHGLTWAGFKWAFTTGHASNWHPLTWLSHMTDFTLSQKIDYWFSFFGYETPNLDASICHSTNVLFHTANVVLLFVLLLRLTGAMWPSALVAALFGWHPLHVESVAWVSERKDVLSTFFALLTLLAYAQYAKGNKRRDFWLALAWFIFGLMSKPMLVTLPLVMMLLDYWPLQRFPEFRLKVRAVLQLALEKWPFFLLAIASCVVTYLAQYHGQAVMSFQRFPLHLRMANALIACERYLGKTFWPSSLAILYPLSRHPTWMWLMTITATGLLGAGSWLVWRVRRQYPCLLVGWLWFLGTLVPVLGLVQVGVAALADRYTYFPLVGVFVIVAFGVRDLVARFQFPKVAIVAAAALALAGCLALTENQLRFWHDSETLFAHALAVTKNNHVAHLDLGVALEQSGKLDEALAQYHVAEQIEPDLFQIHNNLGHLLDKMGRPDEALAEYRLALLLNPGEAPLHKGAGTVLVELGRFDEALAQFNEAARLDSTYPWAPFEIGKLRLKQGRDAEAIDEFRAALRIDPDNFEILAYTAHVLAAIENPEVRDGKTAFALAVKAKVLTGDTQPEVLDALGMACAELGRFEEAQALVQKAMEIPVVAKNQNLGLLHQRLESYRNHQPWRESFLATNSALKTVPPIEPH